MGNELSTTLKSLRKTRGWTLEELARRASITHPTLSRWERGICQPRLPELESVLNALEVSASQRRQTLRQLEAPRAVHRLAAEAPQETGHFQREAGKLPQGGDLLRALRHRHGWTLEDAAIQAGFSASTLSRWEKGESWPSPERLHSLCFVLRATQIELEALTRGRFSLAGPCRDERSPDTLEHEFRTYLEPLLMTSELNPGQELRFLRLEADLWPHAMRRPSLRPLLADVYTYHANYLRSFRRNGVVYARHAQDLMRGTRPLTYNMGVAVVCEADHLVYKKASLDPQSGIRWLRSWIGQEMPLDMKTWMLRKIAGYLSMSSYHEAAFSTLQQACDLAKKTQYPLEERENRRYKAELLLQARRPQESLPHVPEEEDTYASNQIRDLDLRARAFVQLGERAAASAQVASMYTLIAAHGLEHWRKNTDRLAKLL